MRKIGDLMQDLGFNEEAPDSAKKAFIKNLIRQAYGASVEELPTRKKQNDEESHLKGEQLTFDMTKVQGA